MATVVFILTAVEKNKHHTKNPDPSCPSRCPAGTYTTRSCKCVTVNAPKIKAVEEGDDSVVKDKGREIVE
jgi:hypothetical protein